MKTLKLLLLLVFLPLIFHAQQRLLTGLWSGALTNDSVTVKKDLSFEIALTQYKDKVYGYSRRTFIVNDTLYYVLKRLKGTVDGNVCEVRDQEYISYNFPGKVDKGVKITYTFRLNEKDSSWSLDGNWTTNELKKRGYYSIGGKVGLEEEKNFDNSKIFAHLEELKLADDVPFYAATKKPVQTEQPVKDIAVNSKKEDKKQTATPPVEKTTTVNEGSFVVNKPTKETGPGFNESTSKQEPVVKKEEASTEEIVSSSPPKKSALPASTIQAEQKKDVGVNLSKPEIKKQELPVVKQEPVLNSSVEVARAETKKSDLLTTAKASKEKKHISETAAPSPLKFKPTAAAFVMERKTVAPQLVTFKSDSLQLALYDNGEIDGDTVSVLLNGEIFMAKQGLKASAIKKTIYVQPGSEEVTLVLYAENLGKYPPNTGLLVIHDGEDVYQVRFSADLTQNAAVVFRRKK